MRIGQAKDGKALWQTDLRPYRQLRMAELPILERVVEQTLSLMGIWCVEDAADLAGHRLALIKASDIALRVLLQMKLAPLPRHTGKHCFTSRFETRVIDAGNKLDPAQAALDQAIEKSSPMHLSL